MSEMTATRTEWRIAGDEVASCNCAWACGCQFNGPPTYGHCEALVAFLIRTGHFGDLNLDGVRFAEAFYFPGAVHEGNGTRLVILDEASTEEQRSAVLELTSGTQGHPVFEIFASVSPNVLEPVVASIEVESDREARRARIAIPGIGGSRIEPIRNPVTGEEHRVRIDLPDGFEYKQAEIANSVLWELTAGEPLALHNENSYGQHCAFDWSSDGTTR
jgi:hypothetical protein